MKWTFIAPLIAALSFAGAAIAGPNCGAHVDDQNGTITKPMREAAQRLENKGYNVRLGSGYTGDEYVKACGKEGEYIYFIWNGSLEGSGYHSNVTNDADYKHIVQLVKAGEANAVLAYVDDNTSPAVHLGSPSAKIFTTTTTTTKHHYNGGSSHIGYYGSILFVLIAVLLFWIIFFNRPTAYVPPVIVTPPPPPTPDPYPYNIYSNGGGFNPNYPGYNAYKPNGFSRPYPSTYPSTFGIGGAVYPGTWNNGVWGYYNPMGQFIAMETALAMGAVAGAMIDYDLARSAEYGWQPGWGDDTTTTTTTTTTVEEDDRDTGGDFTTNGHDTGADFSNGNGHDTGGDFTEEDDHQDTGGDFTHDGGGDTGGDFGGDTGGDFGGDTSNDNNNGGDF